MSLIIGGALQWIADRVHNLLNGRGRACVSKAIYSICLYTVYVGMGNKVMCVVMNMLEVTTYKKIV